MQRRSMISIAGLSKNFGDVKAVDQVSLEILDGEFLTLLGPSGSGKTTVLRMIAGFEKPDSGSIKLDGIEVSELPPYERAVNTVFQDYALFPHFTVRENIEYGLRIKKVPAAERKVASDQALAQVRLSGYGDRKPAQLSGGQRQRVALARALINKPKVLLLDEPLGALDLKLREQMQLELKDIQREVGITFIFVTHDQEEALTMSDKIAVFNEGKIVQTGSPREIYEKPTSAFVSEFVGQTNKISSQMAAKADLGSTSFNIRPEYLSISKDGKASETDRAINGELKDIIFGGAVTKYLVSTSAGELISTQTTSLSGLEIGDHITLSWSSIKELRTN
ncbi:MAG: ABC transporter ATP-binding protein [Candidatus Nanopelagicaceae bacterium]